MDPERRRKLERLYEAALGYGAGAEREAYLGEVCGDDAELRREVESLLGYASKADSLLETPALGVAARLAPEPKPRLESGARVGPYEILGPLGAGGMGEVYVARDPRLKRRVALKVLPAALARDSERVRRFEREARAVGSIDHPNLLAVHDVGEHEGSPYMVAELLEGETLRERLSGGPLAMRKALDYAAQVARGLAAAHEKGIVHRDLKPENLFVMRDGRVKILDFGLAKLGAVTGADDAPTVTAGTSPGVVMGTVVYMSPEQARGEKVDHRSDVFSFGSVLHEMLTGRSPFLRGSSAETMAAILNDDPPSVGADVAPPGLARLVAHCLEKRPDERFQSARDIAFDLESLAEPSGAQPAPVIPAPIGRRRLWLVAALVAAALVVAFLAGWWIAPRGEPGSAPVAEVSQPTFRQLTFRRGNVLAARFAPDGRSFVFAASWDGKPPELFQASPEFPDARSLGIGAKNLLAISPSNELAVLVGDQPAHPFTGTLALVPITGGAPREVLEDVDAADWAPDGSTLAVVRTVAGRDRLEYPVGNVLYESNFDITDVRVSPGGDSIAFLDHPVQSDDRGTVAIVSRDGRLLARSEAWTGEAGLAWAPSGEEVWFTAADVGNVRALRAMTRAGQVRLVLRTPGAQTLRDISRDGRVLLERSVDRFGIMALAPGETKERDLSWLDGSSPVGLSADATTLLFWEFGEGAGVEGAVCIRKMDGSLPVRLGAGQPIALSPDGRWVLALKGISARDGLVLVPTGVGQPRSLDRGDIVEYQPSGAWTPDGKQVVFAAATQESDLQTFIQDVDGGPPRPLTPTGAILAGGGALSVDGASLIAIDGEQKYWIYPVSGGEPRPLLGVSPNDAVSGWSADGRSVFVRPVGAREMRIDRLDVATGRRTLWRESVLADPAGISGIAAIRVTPDGSAYAYLYMRTLSDLYLVEGLK